MNFLKLFYYIHVNCAYMLTYIKCTTFQVNIVVKELLLITLLYFPSNYLSKRSSSNLRTLCGTISPHDVYSLVRFALWIIHISSALKKKKNSLMLKVRHVRFAPPSRKN